MVDLSVYLGIDIIGILFHGDQVPDLYGGILQDHFLTAYGLGVQLPRNRLQTLDHQSVLAGNQCINTADLV